MAFHHGIASLRQGEVLLFEAVYRDPDHALAGHVLAGLTR